MEYKIIADGACDLYGENADKIGVQIVPFYVAFEENVYKKEGAEIEVRHFYKEMVENPTVFPKTSMPSVQAVSTARLIWISLVDLVTGKYGFNDLSGPVGLVGAIGDAADAGKNIKESVMTLMNLTVFITINLGIFNLLPIPGLDGGRFLFLLIEAVRRKPVKPEHEGFVHLIGMALLMLLIVAVTFSDIKKLIG